MAPFIESCLGQLSLMDLIEHDDISISRVAEEEPRLSRRQVTEKPSHTSPKMIEPLQFEFLDSNTDQCPHIHQSANEGIITG